MDGELGMGIRGDLFSYLQYKWETDIECPFFPLPPPPEQHANVWVPLVLDRLRCGCVCVCVCE